MEALKALSTLIIIYEGRWRNPHEFFPSSLAHQQVLWDEGTGTIIGCDRASVFILSSIHKKSASKCTFWIKGRATEHRQIPATLVENRYEENDGIDVAMFSCPLGAIDATLLSRYLPAVRWSYPDTFQPGAAVWLVHYPTFDCTGTEATSRLRGAVEPDVAYGEVLSHDVATFLFDSTIEATAGSSGGVIVDADGFVVGVHDSIHDVDPPAAGDRAVVSSHRAAAELRQHFLTHLPLLVDRKGLF